MYFIRLLILGFAAIVSAAALAEPEPNPKAEAYNELAAIEGALSHAILVGRSILANPHAAHDAPAKRAADYLSAAFDAAEKRSVAEVTAPELERRGRWCGYVGQGCGKVKRSAGAVRDILGAPELKKRVAGRWCGYVGQGCGKAKRDIGRLLKASEDVLAAYDG